MRSLNTGFDEMSLLVQDFDFDVFAVTETWLQPGTSLDNFRIPGFSICAVTAHEVTHRTLEVVSSFTSKMELVMSNASSVINYYQVWKLWCLKKDGEITWFDLQAFQR